jgi:acid phosphatase
MDRGQKLWQERYEKVYDAPSLQIPWYPVLGNHDHQGNVAAQIAYSKRSQRWRMPATQYVHGEKLGVASAVDFFFIDTDPIRRQYRSWTGRLRRNAQIAWLDQQLARSRAPWKIVVGHHPIFSAERRKNARALVTHLKPVLERHRVQAYVHGHSHTLAHIEAKGVHYLTSGAGALPRRADEIADAKFARGDQLGFLAMRISPGSMVVEFWSADGEALYRASIQAKYE